MKKYVFFTLIIIMTILISSCAEKNNTLSQTSKPNSEIYVEKITGKNTPNETEKETPMPTQTSISNPTEKTTVTHSEIPTETATQTPRPTVAVTVSPTLSPTATQTEKQEKTGTPEIVKTPSPLPNETYLPSDLGDDYTAKEYTIDGIKIIEDIVYERKNPKRSIVEVEDGEELVVVPDEETGYYYTTEESLLSDDVYDYLKNQTSSNSLSRIHSPQRIIGRGYLSGTPFFYIPLINTSINKRGDYDKVVIGNADYAKGKILAVCYSYPKKAASRVSSVDCNKLYMEAVYLDTAVDSLDNEQSLCPDDMTIKQEKHLGILVTRPVSEDYKSDYIFLAYPLTNGKYVINCGGGIIVLNSCPTNAVDIRFSAGGGCAGFINFQLFVDERKIFECERFCINSYEGDCKCYAPYNS